MLCCFCIPVGCGMKCLGVWHILLTIFYGIELALMIDAWMAGGRLYRRMYFLNSIPITPIAYMVVYVLNIVGLVFFICYFCNDSKGTRGRLQWVFVFQILTVVFHFIMVVMSPSSMSVTYNSRISSSYSRSSS